MAKRERAQFVIQRLIGSAHDGRKCPTWQDFTNPANDEENFASTAACEVWIRNNAELFGNEPPTLRIVQVKRCMKMDVQVKRTVSFEDQQIVTPTTEGGDEVGEEKAGSAE